MQQCSNVIFRLLQRLGSSADQPRLLLPPALDQQEPEPEGGLEALPPPPRLHPTVRRRGQAAPVKARRGPRHPASEK